MSSIHSVVGKSVGQAILTAVFGAFILVGNLNSATPEYHEWAKKMEHIKWVAYSPSTGNPEANIDPTIESIEMDLEVLKRAGFTGLVTYGTNTLMGNELVDLAKEKKFQGVILGIWDPKNKDEAEAAFEASKDSIVLGLCIGNEGLRSRYSPEELSLAIEVAKKETKKPVTTTEQIEDYSNPELLAMGDWIFPNTHPYFHKVLDSKISVDWTTKAYRDLESKADNRLVLFKEVGFPTSGDPEVSEKLQFDYYQALAESPVKFVYFEAFDLPWKNHLPIEPHWGLFGNDRTPKQVAAKLLDEQKEKPLEVFYVYQNLGLPKGCSPVDPLSNHFTPSGYMGDTSDIAINEGCTIKPYRGAECIQVVYSATGTNGWAGVYWQQPANNWGKDVTLAERGYVLSEYSRVTFYARSEKPCYIEFKVGGIAQPYGDSLTFPKAVMAKLDEHWRQFEIDLKESDLSHIIGGFVFVTNSNVNPKGAKFWLDDIRFEE